MMKLRIDYPKTYLPQSMAKGSTEQRLQLARLMNLRFFDNLQDAFKNREVRPGTFKKVLKDTVGKPIRIDIAESSNPKAGRMSHILKGEGIASGYCIELPLTFYYKNIHQSSALIFLQETQKFFEEILNPKFFKRFITLLNSGCDINKLGKFYQENITGTNKLTSKALEKYLKGKPTKQQIDILQFCRYQLIKEQNSCVGIRGIERGIEKHSGLRYQHSDDFYSFKEHEFKQKFEIIENKLKELIQSQRVKK